MNDEDIKPTIGQIKVLIGLDNDQHNTFYIKILQQISCFGKG